MGLFQAPQFDVDVGPVEDDECLHCAPHQRPGDVFEELFAANREIRRLRVALNQIANAPRKAVVADVKAMAVEALAKGRSGE